MDAEDVWLSDDQPRTREALADELGCEPDQVDDWIDDPDDFRDLLEDR